jgi:50S ribosomal subunit-associated GTPase HflX
LIGTSLILNLKPIEQLSILILGNKCDSEEKRQVKQDEVKNLEYESFEVSALTGQNVDAAFNRIIELMKKKRLV